MKLYAKIKSERGKPLGKGGNTNLNIELLSGSVSDPHVEYVLDFNDGGLQVTGDIDNVVLQHKEQGECKAKP